MSDLHDLQDLATPSLAWTDNLVLNQPELDHTHQEFVELLNRYGEALDRGEDALPAFRELLAHTEDHFAMEERWMAATGFEPQNCHSSQHAMVLNVMREVVRYADELGDREPLAIVRQELVQWFPSHAEMMDAALVYTMQQRGFDPATGQAQPTTQLPEGEKAGAGCGSTACGH
ncbi:hemerythrin domain-containing protein [Roseateles amylovorans]|jgi:hemerythrin|uniref:Hemerythrin domain-containing protein n=1 Tax=Roseateles amylovorans TaxID=2978473 RepID=A0ABY6B0Y2_9BURK|nr:hemerythrin domain-containing protein [Roseateles amylovorans]UXH76985.1 hemerythrin domain-containing protein [Roseateles amylovorans]